MAETARTELAPNVEDFEERRAEIADRKRIENARSWAEAWIEEHDLDFIAFARSIGLGDAGRSAVSNFVRCKLSTDPTRLVLAVESYRATIEGPDGISAVIQFRTTRNVLKIWTYADAARDQHRMSALIGYTGYGKTESIRRYQQRTWQDKKPPVRIITCNSHFSSRFLCRMLAMDLGLVQKGGESALMLEMVARRLRGHPEFLIFDEANFLSEKCLHDIRYLHDVTGCGVLLIGTPWFLNMVANRSRSHAPNPLGDKATALDGPLALFADRIFTDMVPGLYEDEVLEIAADVLKAEFEDDAASKLVVYVNHNFRLLTRLLIELREFRKKTGVKKINVKAIEGAWLKTQKLDLR